ncbi:MAG: hypothetical protein GWP06_04610 [Actinobacteria bacterium]|nr:hypothetical protein [Actinomycetota bacterium]
MSFGHTLFTIGGLVILSTFILSVNNSIVQNVTTMTQSSVIMEAIALGEKYIEEAETCRFDEDPSATIPSSFVTSANLGPDGNESYPNFDDVDDFDDFSVTDALSASVPFTINIDVSYVTLNHPDVPTSNRTYYKRMTVSVSSPALTSLPANTLKLKRLFAYHYFYTE